MAGGALVALTAKALILNRWPAPSAFLHDFGVLVEAILASVVASYVFYLFVVHLKEVSDRETVGPYIDRHTLRVVGDCESQLFAIGKVSGSPVALENISLKAVTEAFSNIPPYSNAPLLLGPKTNKYANWFEYFEHHKQRTRESIARVMAQLIYVDAKRVSLLAAVDDCSHFSMIQHFLHMPVSNPDMSAFANTFHDYCVFCLALKQHMSEAQSAL
ncbi:MAG: hypothetical protein B7X62_04500 [Burkholderiales bacterium 39-55-53]|nr:MAG: hypothetical protein B7Y06_00505 [Burkholderiales bacterium 24-55-52]OZB02058.1 MAG: hypothetical protein B7X62_04500 [Burkholderiales bacterium 39-55-53]